MGRDSKYVVRGSVSPAIATYLVPDTYIVDLRRRMAAW